LKVKFFGPETGEQEMKFVTQASNSIIKFLWLSHDKRKQLGRGETSSVEKCFLAGDKMLKTSDTKLRLTFSEDT